MFIFSQRQPRPLSGLLVRLEARGDQPPLEPSAEVTTEAAFVAVHAAGEVVADDHA